MHSNSQTRGECTIVALKSQIHSSGKEELETCRSLTNCLVNKILQYSMNLKSFQEIKEARVSNLLVQPHYSTLIVMHSGMCHVCQDHMHTASTEASAGPLILITEDSMSRRYPCSGAIK